MPTELEQNLTVFVSDTILGRLQLIVASGEFQIDNYTKINFIESNLFFFGKVDDSIQNKTQLLRVVPEDIHDISANMTMEELHEKALVQGKDFVKKEIFSVCKILEIDPFIPSYEVRDENATWSLDLFNELDATSFRLLIEKSKCLRFRQILHKFIKKTRILMKIDNS